MLATNFPKIIPIMNRILISHSGRANILTAIAVRGFRMKSTPPLGLATFNTKLSSTSSDLLIQFRGNLPTIRFYADGLSTPPPNRPKILGYWDGFIDRKQKFEDDVDHYLARWPKIQTFRRRVINRMQAVRGSIVDSIMNSFKFSYGKILGAWDVTGGAVVKSQRDFAEMQKAKDSGDSILKQRPDSSIYRFIAFLWNINNWIIFVIRPNHGQSLKNSKMRIDGNDVPHKISKVGEGQNTPPKGTGTFDK